MVKLLLCKNKNSGREKSISVAVFLLFGQLYCLFIISGKAKHIPDFVYVHIQDHGKLIDGEPGGVIIVCEFFYRGFQVFYLGYKIIIAEFLLRLR